MNESFPPAPSDEQFPQPPLPSQTSQLAVVSLVMGILGLVCCGIFTAVPAVVCGHMARARIRQEAHLQGDGLALAGLITGYIGLVFSILALVFYVAVIAAGGGEFSTVLEEVLREAGEASQP